MDEKQMRAVVKEAVKETLISLGIDACNPMEMQQDFHFLRDVRQTAEKVKSKVPLAAVGVLVAALLGAVWLGLKELLGGGS